MPVERGGFTATKSVFHFHRTIRGIGLPVSRPRSLSSAGIEYSLLYDFQKKHEKIRPPYFNSGAVILF
jgi:hypothetical protein